MGAETLLLLCLAIPGGAALLILLGRRSLLLAEAVTLLAPPALLCCVVLLLPGMHDCDGSVLALGLLGQGLQLAFAPEATGMLFALLAALLWVPTSWYAIGYARGGKLANAARFHAMFALAMACTMGIALSDNLLTLFVFYEMLTLSTWGLVGHNGTAEARAGGRTYLLYLLGSSLALLLPAIITIHVVYGGLDFTPGGIINAGNAPDAPSWLPALLYAMLVFGTGKAALMPVHRWLPGAMVAPTPVSALLHAVAVVKAGVFTILKASLLIFGTDALQGHAIGEVMVWLASFSIVAASVVALRSDNIKRRLAYSTVGQLAYVTLGAVAMNPGGAIAAGMHMVAHGATKITMFFCAGIIIIATGRTNVSQCNGIGRRMPLVFIIFAISAVALAGIPPSLNLWSKWHLLGAFSQDYQIIPLAALGISSMLGLWYLLELPLRAFFAPANPDAESVKGKTGGKVPPLCTAAIVFTTITGAALFLCAETIYQWLLQPMMGAAYCDIRIAK